MTEFESKNPEPKLSQDYRDTLRNAQGIARLYRSEAVGTEHLLLATIRHSSVERVLKDLGTSYRRVHINTDLIIGCGNKIIEGEIVLTPRSRKVVELSKDECIKSNSPQVTPEHLLAGLVREGEGLAAGILEAEGITIAKIRDYLK